uniref:hypothetical protein n=1 Tax=Bacillus multifaciens TaxID=3068506 RepID=UPI003F493FF6
MNLKSLEKELETILFCKELMSETLCIGGSQRIEFVRNGTKYMYFAVTCPGEENVFYRIDELMDTYKLVKNEWKYTITL